MLWLAGLMGIASVGAASLITFPEPEEHDEEIPNADDMVQAGYNLLDEVDGIENMDAPESDLFDLVAQDIRAETNDDDDYSVFKTSHFEDDIAPVDVIDEPPLVQEQVLVGNWISSGPVSEVFDYEANNESLLLVWDDMVPTAEEPQVDVAPDPYDDEVMHVLMNDKSVAEIYGDPELTAADVTLIPLSSALIVGLQPA